MDPLMIGSFLFFTALVGVLTWWITHNDETSSSTGYFLAGRSLTFPLIAGSLLLTNLSTEQMVGLNGDAFINGFCVMVWEVVSVISMVAMAWFFLPRFLKSGVATVPEYLRLRFDSQTEAITNVIFLVAYVGILLPMILYTGAEGMMGILDVPTMLNQDIDTSRVIIVIAVGVIGSTYALFGGLKTVAVSDTINGVGLLVGGFLITIFALSALGNLAPSDAENGVLNASAINASSATDSRDTAVSKGWITSVTDGTKRLYSEQKERFNSIGSNQTSAPFGEVFSGIFLLTLFYWATNQQIIQRTFGASNLAEGQKGVLLTGALKLLGPLYLVLPGMIAYSLFAGDIEFSATQVAVGDDPSQISVAVDASLNGETSEIQIPMSISQSSFWGSGDGFIQQSAALQVEGIEDDKAVDHVREQLGMIKSSTAYGKLVERVLPKWLTGFFAAVMLGAILSSFNSALNSSCTLFSLGLFKNLNRFRNTKGIVSPEHEFSEKQIVGSGKIFGIVVAIAAMVIAPTFAANENIFQFLQKMNGIYAIPILAVVLVAMVSRRVPPLAAKIGLVTGFVVLILGNFVSPFNDIVGTMGNGFYFLGTVFAWLVIMMLVIGELHPSESEWIQKDVGAVDMTPWRHAGKAGVALILVVVGIYAVFAEF